MAGYITAEGLVVPAGSDFYDYVNDWRRGAASIRSVVPAANTAAGDTIASAMATDGRPVSDNNPLVIFDQSTQRLNVKGTAGWTNLGYQQADLTGPLNSWIIPFATGTRRPRVWTTDGITAHITGLVQYGGGVGTLFNLPSWCTPAGADYTYINTSQTSGNGATTGGVAVSFGIQSGQIKVIYQTAGLPTNAYVALTGSWLINT